ncbi:MAG: GTP 3',8-cyclase MoaA [Fidelibacterota bacterium]
MEIKTYPVNALDSEPVFRVHPVLNDRFGRRFDYLRIALNEHCNLRCIYCMPERGIRFRSSSKLITTREIIRIIQIASGLGVKKIRFTGGEPLLNPDLFRLVKAAVQDIGIESVHITTNGLLLVGKIAQLKKAGLSGVNISLDTLERKKYTLITRRDGLFQVLEGLRAALRAKINVKINVVALRGFNDSEIPAFVALTRQNPVTVRFIELMPFDAHQIWKTGKFYSQDHIVEDLHEHFPSLVPAEGTKTEQKVFRLPGYCGKIAVIPSYSRDICSSCNRIRITADGKIRNCLYATNEYDLRAQMHNGGTDVDLVALLKKAMWNKPEDGWSAQSKGTPLRESMTQIGG